MTGSAFRPEITRVPIPHQQYSPAPPAAGRRGAAAEPWLLLAGAVAGGCIAAAVLHTTARRSPAHVPARTGTALHVPVTGDSAPAPAVLRLAWITPRLVAARALSARPELKAAVLGGFVAAALTAAVPLMMLQGLPTQPGTRVLTAGWTMLIGWTMWHLKAVMQATVNTRTGFLADAIPAEDLMRRTIEIAGDLERQLEEAVTETAHLSQANAKKFARYNRAQDFFGLSILAAAAAFNATLAGGW
ncbi:hypothetical protein JCM9534A_35860 [Catenuloplanes indicus JCM 9534]